jgi:imidazolonepropionase-like amidohydrolase
MHRTALTLLALTALPVTTALADTAPVTAVLCGHLFDSTNGSLAGPTTVVISGDRVQSVTSGLAAPAGAHTIDLSAETCLPGLIDAHTHLLEQTSPNAYLERTRLNGADYAYRSTQYARRTLLAGFTTVRNLGDSPSQDSVALRNAINTGTVWGPRIYTAGRAIGSTGGHADPTNGLSRELVGDPGVAEGIINSVDDAVKAIRVHYKQGVDAIKIMPSGGVMDEGASGENPQLTLEEIKALVTTAHDYGFTVAAHAHGAEAIRRAVIGGVDSIEHGTFLNDEDMKLMKEHGTYLVPTISAGSFVASKAKVPGYYPPQVARKALEIGPQILATAGRAYKAGVKIAFGTDAGVYPHGDNGHEFELMVEAGMPPAYALTAATMSAATLLRHDKDLGSVTVGKYADLVAVPGNPLTDISLMRNISFVMKSGVVYKSGGHAVAND